MWNDPGTINKGLGKLTPQVWQGVMRAVAYVHRNMSQLDRMIKQFGASQNTERNMFFARLTHFRHQEAFRYIYAWEAVQFDALRLDGYNGRTQLGGYMDLSVYEEGQDGLTSTVDGDPFYNAAVNTLELGYGHYGGGLDANGNTVLGAGVDINTGNYPRTYSMQPIGGAPANPDVNSRYWPYQEAVDTDYPDITNAESAIELINKPIVPMFITRSRFPAPFDGYGAYQVRYVFCVSNTHDGDSC
tara:strand:+ start:1644 stop:2375 length:732 start_codon:yes stop_codon:yes gene_type:complete